FGLTPEPLAHIPLSIHMRVNRSLFLPVGLCRDHGLRSTRFDHSDQRLLVVPFVGDDHLWFVIRQQHFRLTDVGRLSRRHLQFDGLAETIEAPMNLGPDPAAAATKRLIVLAARPVPLFFEPAALAWARITVESRIRTSKSGSRNTAARAANRPAWAQRSNRR